jgi:hypothetical protein
MLQWIMFLPLDIILELSIVYDVDPKLIAAIVSVESYGKTCATRYEPRYKWLFEPKVYARQNKITLETEVMHQKTSWGLMQIMGACARELGYDDYLVNLCDPKIGLKFGILHLKNYLKKYENIDDAISSYNQGAPRKDDGGKYLNQHYVNEVKTRYEYISSNI